MSKANPRPQDIKTAERLNNLKEDYNLTQKELADLVGVTPATMSDICRGFQGLAPEYAEKIAEYVNSKEPAGSPMLINQSWLAGTSKRKYIDEPEVNEWIPDDQQRIDAVTDALIRCAMDDLGYTEKNLHRQYSDGITAPLVEFSKDGAPVAKASALDIVMLRNELYNYALFKVGFFIEKALPSMGIEEDI